MFSHVKKPASAGLIARFKQLESLEGKGQPPVATHVSPLNPIPFDLDDAPDEPAAMVEDLDAQVIAGPSNEPVQQQVEQDDTLVEVPETSSAVAVSRRPMIRSTVEPTQSSDDLTIRDGNKRALVVLCEGQQLWRMLVSFGQSRQHNDPMGRKRRIDALDGWQSDDFDSKSLQALQNYLSSLGKVSAGESTATELLETICSTLNDFNPHTTTLPQSSRPSLSHAPTASFLTDMLLLIERAICVSCERSLPPSPRIRQRSDCDVRAVRRVKRDLSREFSNCTNIISSPLAGTALETNLCGVIEFVVLAQTDARLTHAALSLTHTLLRSTPTEFWSSFSFLLDKSVWQWHISRNRARWESTPVFFVCLAVYVSRHPDALTHIQPLLSRDMVGEVTRLLMLHGERHTTNVLDIRTRLGLLKFLSMLLQKGGETVATLLTPDKDTSLCVGLGLVTHLEWEFLDIPENQELRVELLLCGLAFLQRLIQLCPFTASFALCTATPLVVHVCVSLLDRIKWDKSLSRAEMACAALLKNLQIELL
eukprot:c18369_g1_i1.p1 GENE.c18369_g1_i1~~c18369_g1_i1.p1  ORF type:complete len:536 (+),score=87.72 c18369_g1_i1:860-2467(+)